MARVHMHVHDVCTYMYDLVAMSADGKASGGVQVCVLMYTCMCVTCAGWQGEWGGVQVCPARGCAHVHIMHSCAYACDDAFMCTCFLVHVHDACTYMYDSGTLLSAVLAMHCILAHAYTCTCAYVRTWFATYMHAHLTQARRRHSHLVMHWHFSDQR